MHFNAVTLYSTILEKCKNLILTNSEEKNCMLHLSEFFSFTFLVQINFYLSMESQLCFIYSTSRNASQPIIAYMFQKSKSNICLKKVSTLYCKCSWIYSLFERFVSLELWKTRKYLLCGYILGVLAHTTACFGPALRRWWNTEMSYDKRSLD